MDSFSLILNWKESLNVENLIHKIDSIIKITNAEKDNLLKRLLIQTKKIKTKIFFITKNLSKKKFLN